MVDGANGGAPLKKYEGNITAAFGTDLFVHGVTFIPNLLLQFYPRMGLTESEVMLLIHLLRIRVQEKNLFPSREVLGECLSGGVEQAERDLAGLREKAVLGVTHYYLEDTGVIAKGFDFEPLFEKLSELWACSKVSEIERTQAVLESGHSKLQDRELGILFEEFASEFGRPISPIEAEQIGRWRDEVGNTLTREALKRAVLLGKLNFRYIDSIVREWRKNGLTTLNAVREYEKRFQERRTRKTPRKTVADNSEREKEIALIKTLYIS